jgi:hypothetical protein
MANVGQIGLDRVRNPDNGFFDFPFENYELSSRGPELSRRLGDFLVYLAREKLINP